MFFSDFLEKISLKKEYKEELNKLKETMKNFYSAGKVTDYEKLINVSETLLIVKDETNAFSADLMHLKEKTNKIKHYKSYKKHFFSILDLRGVFNEIKEFADKKPKTPEDYEKIIEKIKETNNLLSKKKTLLRTMP